MASSTAIRAAAGVPPWLWFWAVAYAVNMPFIIEHADHVVDLWPSFLEFLRQAWDAGPVDAMLAVLLLPAMVIDLLPTLLFLTGAIAVAFPHLRAIYLERRFRLTSPPNHVAVVEEISTFVHEHAPNLQVKVNFARVNPIAFVYPTSFGATTLALFGGFLKLWRADRAAAEAVLLHEIAHYRRGDTRIMGAGSLFESIVKVAIVYFGAVLPVVLVASLAVGLHANPVSEVADALRSDVFSAQMLFFQITYHAEFSLANLADYLAMSLFYLFYIVTLLVLPVAAIWSAELNADHIASYEHRSGSGIVGALNVGEQAPTRLRSMLQRLSHPPGRLRARFVTCHGGTAGAWLLLMVYPAAYLIQLAALHARATLSYVISDFSSQDVLRGYVDNTGFWLEDRWRYFLPIAMILLLWGYLYRGWEFLFTRRMPPVVAQSATAHRYGAIVVVAVALAGIGVSISAEPQSGEDTDGVVTQSEPTAIAASSPTTTRAMAETPVNSATPPFGDMLPEDDDFQHVYALVEEEPVGAGQIVAPSGFIEGKRRVFLLADPAVRSSEAMWGLDVTCLVYEADQYAEDAMNAERDLITGLASASLETVSIEPLGDASLAIDGTWTTPEGTTRTAVIWMRSGPMVCQYLGNADKGSPLSDVLDVVRVIESSSASGQ